MSVHFECWCPPESDGLVHVQWHNQAGGGTHSTNDQHVTGANYRPACEYGKVSHEISSVYPSTDGESGSEYIRCITGIDNEEHQQRNTNNNIKNNRLLIHELNQQDRLSPMRRIVSHQTSSQGNQMIEWFGSDGERAQSSRSDRHHQNQHQSQHQSHNLSQRVAESQEYGVVHLIITHLGFEDSGVYQCRARNQGGEAVSTAVVRVDPKRRGQSGSSDEQGQQEANRNLNWLSVEKLRQLEEPKEIVYSEEERFGEPPRFVAHIQPEYVEKVEGDSLHFECRLVPVGDPYLFVEWYFNGRPLVTDSRVHTSDDIDYVLSDVEYISLPQLPGVSRNISGHGQRSIADDDLTQTVTYLTDDNNRINRNNNTDERTTTINNRYITTNDDPQTLQQTKTTTTTTRTTSGGSVPPLAGANKISTSTSYQLEGSPRAPPGIKPPHHKGPVVDSNYMTDDSSTTTAISYNRGGQDLSSPSTTNNRYSTTTTTTTTTNNNNNSTNIGSNNYRKSNENDDTTTSHLLRDIHTTMGDLQASLESRTNSRQQTTQRDTNNYQVAPTSMVEQAPTDRYRRSVPTQQAPQPYYYYQQQQTPPYPQQHHMQHHERPYDQYYQDPNHPGANRTDPPARFLTRIKGPDGTSDVLNLQEGESVHLECWVSPATDGLLQVEWYHDGEPLISGHRFRPVYEFGYVALDILYVYPEDSGEYKCVATNKSGQDVTSARLRVRGKPSLIYDSQLPKEMEAGVEKIAKMEASWNRPYTEGPVVEPLGVGGGRGSGGSGAGMVIVSGGMPRLEEMGPMVTVPLTGTQHLVEGQTAYMECRIEPVDDGRLEIEYFHNGEPLVAGSRYHITSDFGYISIIIDHMCPEDSGRYTVRVSNRQLNKMVETHLDIQVDGLSSVQTDSLHHEALPKLQRLEMGVPAREFVGGERVYQVPQFTQQVTPESVFAQENETVDFVCHLVPIEDPSLKVEWFVDNVPLQTGSRFHCEHEFGVVRLRISHLCYEDSGVYQCRARNKAGEAVSTALVRVEPRDAVQSETLHPLGLEKIRQLEEPKEMVYAEEEKLEQAPKFITHIQPDYVEKNEGDSVHFECRLAPLGDPDLKTEWYFNGRPLVTGSRVHTLDDFGYVLFDIDYLYQRDTGEYVCRASNKFGTDITQTVLRVKADKKVVCESQLEKPLSADRLRQLEYPDVPEELIPVKVDQPARFLTPIQGPNGTNEALDLQEGDSVHFECRVGPASDGLLQVEWYHNDRPLISGHRFRPIYEFGYVALDILYVYPEDSGEYKCVATNKSGQDVTSARLAVRGKPSLIYKSQLPKEMEKGVEKITQMEAMWNRPPDAEEADVVMEKMGPQFALKPKPVVAFENSCARFCCRIIGYPRPRLIWVVNGQTVVTGSRYKLTYDGMYHLEIPKCRLQDQGKIEVYARNPVGECFCTTELKVLRRVDDYRNVLKNSPRPWYDEQALKVYQRQRSQDEDDEDAAQTSGSDRETLGLNLHHQQMDPNNKQQITSYMEPGTPDHVNLLAAGGDQQQQPALHPLALIKQQTVMAPSPSTIKRALSQKDSVVVMSPGSPTTTTTTTSATITGAGLLSPRGFSPGGGGGGDGTSPISPVSPGGGGGVEVREGGARSPFQPPYQQPHHQVNQPQYLEEWSQQLQHQQQLNQQRKQQQERERLQRLRDHQLNIGHQQHLQSSNQMMEKNNYPSNNQQKQVRETTLVTTTTGLRAQQDQQPGGGGQVVVVRAATPESTVHGKEIHSHTHKQTQLERRPDQEITRHIIERETIEQEHKGFTQERVVRSSPPAGLRVSVSPSPSPSPSLLPQPASSAATNANVIRLIDNKYPNTNTNADANIKEIILVEGNKSNGHPQHLIPPEFTKKIQPCRAFDGDSAQFSCSFLGEPKPSITWFRESKPIKSSNLYTISTTNNSLDRNSDGEGQSQLNIRRVGLNDNAVYTVKAENEAGSAKSSANLIVEPLPSNVNGQQQQLAIQSGPMIVKTTTITSTSSHNSNQQQPHSGTNEIINVTTSKQEIKPTTNANNSITGGATPPNFLLTIHDQVGKLGELVRFDARIHGSEPMDVRWFKDGQVIRADIGHKMVKDRDQYTLLILECNQTDAGPYQCVAINRVGEARCEAELILSSPTTHQQHHHQHQQQQQQQQQIHQHQHLKHPQQQQQQQDSRVTRSVSPVGVTGSPHNNHLLSATGSGTTIVTTTRQTTSEEIAEGTLEAIAAGKTTTTANTSSPSTVGAAQLAGSSPQQQKHQQQKGNPKAPKLIKKLDDQIVEEGKSITLRCQISSFPIVEVSWYKDKSIIKPSKYFRIFKDNDETYCLRILEAFPEDEGIYKCVARGKDEQSSVVTAAKVTVLAITSESESD